MSKEIIILTGNIGTGKSTLAREYQKKGYIVVARDGLRYAIGGGNYIFDKKYEPIIWDIELYLLESFMVLGINIVVDEVGINKALRKRYIDLAKSYSYIVKCYLLPKLGMKESVDRRMQDPHQQADRKMWEQTWVKFSQAYEEPSFEEGIDQIIRNYGDMMDEKKS